MQKSIETFRALEREARELAVDALRIALKTGDERQRIELRDRANALLSAANGYAMSIALMRESERSIRHVS